MDTETELNNLVHRAVEGDEAALSAALEQCDPTLRRRLGGQIPRRWQSVLGLDDVLQETYTDAYLGIKGFTPDGDGAFARWVTTIGKHNLSNAIRDLETDKRGGRLRRLDPGQQDESFVAMYEMLGGTTTTASRHAARREARHAVTRAIGGLPDDHRRVVELYDIQGLPIDEVAGALGRSPGAVFMLRARAHRALRKYLGSPLNYFSDFA